ncbi:hypothetical protein LWE69_11780 [Paenibacillus sp. UKAQ_18]|nr:hypothetical protein [Paenibacillus sp. UKAQ_18]
MISIFQIINTGWFGSIVGITGIIYSVYTFRKQKIGPRFCYQTSTLKVIGGYSEQFKQDELEIFFEGEKVDAVSKTQIAFWNSGFGTIKGEDIVERDQLRAKFSEDSKILSMSIVTQSRNVNRIELNKNSENEVLINFEFLDSKDGGIIEIVHTDTKSRPNLIGTVKGLPNVLKDKGDIVPYPILQIEDGVVKKRKVSILNLLFIIIQFALILFLYIGSIISYLLNKLDNGIIIITVMVTLMFIIVCYLTFKNRIKFPKKIYQNRR